MSDTSGTPEPGCVHGWAYSHPMKCQRCAGNGCWNTACSRPRHHPDACDAPSPRDCRHGRLARSCSECEDYEEIARLRAEVERLTFERESALKFAEKQKVALDLVSGALMDCLPGDCVQPSPVGYGEAIRMSCRRHDAEVERLREALQRIRIVASIGNPMDPAKACRTLDEIDRIVAALEGKP